jgi:hypothetical protein
LLMVLLRWEPIAAGGENARSRELKLIQS